MAEQDVIGYATLQIIPSMKGVGERIAQQLDAPLAEGGRRGGARIADGIREGIARGGAGAAAAGARAGESYGSKFADAARDRMSGVLEKTASLGAGVFKGLAIGAGVASTAIAGFGIKGAAGLETTQTAFTSLLGSSAAATAQIQALQKFAAATPFSQKDVLGYAQQYYSLANSIGMSKAQVQPFLTAIGNLGAVTGASTDNIHNAVMAIGQIGSAGKVSLDNLNQISEAFPGFNGAAAIAAATGQSTAQVMKQISAGTIDAQTGVAALIQGMQKFPGAAGAMTKQSQTLSGMWSTFTDTLQIELTQAFRPVLPDLKKLFGQITPVLGSLFKSVAPVIANLMKAVIPAIAPLLQAVGPLLGSIVKAVTPVLASLGPAIGVIAHALSSFVQALAPVLAQLSPLLAPVASLIAMLLSAARPLIPLVGQIALTLGRLLVGALRSVIVAITPVVAAIAKALAPVLPILSAALEQVLRALQPLLTAMGTALVSVIASIAPVLPPLSQAFGQIAIVFARIIADLAPLLPLVAQLIVSLINPKTIALITTVATALAAIASAIEPLIPVVVSLVTTALSPFLTAISSMADLISSVALPALQTLVNAVLSAVGFIVDSAASAFGWVPFIGSGLKDAARKFDAFKNDVNTALSGITPDTTVDVTANVHTNITAGGVPVETTHGGEHSGPGFSGYDPYHGGVPTKPAAAAGASSIPSAMPDPAIQQQNAAAAQQRQQADQARKEAAQKLASARKTLGDAARSIFTDINSQLRSGKINVSDLRDKVTAFRDAVRGVLDAGGSVNQQAVDRVRRDIGRLDTLDAALTKVTNRLASAKDKLTGLISDYRNTVSSARDTVTGTFDITTAGTIQDAFGVTRAPTGARILADLRAKVAAAARFAGELARLRRRGLNPQLVDEIAQAGPSAEPEAAALLRTPYSTFSSINRNFKQLQTYGTQAGTSAARALYGAGIASARGIVTGLQHEEGAIERQMTRIARLMEAAIKRALRIASPSRLMHEVGAFTALGLAAGMDDNAHHVVASARGLASAALPDTSGPRNDTPGSGATHQHTWHVESHKANPRAIAQEAVLLMGGLTV